tara:strand:+ start:1185 stop:1499 length:315 start_codon:yes stop_codon:yes gene_type:complete
MSLYQSIKTVGKKAAAVVGLVSLLGACGPTLEQSGDLTGDGIIDAIVKIEKGLQSGTWLFIGQEDGSFVRATQTTHNKVKYFETNEGVAYFFDGEIYKPSVEQE